MLIEHWIIALQVQPRFSKYSKVPPLRNSIFQNSLFHFPYKDIFQQINFHMSTDRKFEYNGKLPSKYSFRHLTMQQLKVENVILIWEAGTNNRAFQTGLAVQEARFFFTKTQNIQLFLTHKKLYRKQPVEFLEYNRAYYFGKIDQSF